jgi:hypothetical protein
LPLCVCVKQEESADAAGASLRDASSAALAADDAARTSAAASLSQQLKSLSSSVTAYRARVVAAPGEDDGTREERARAVARLEDVQQHVAELEYRFKIRFDELLDDTCVKEKRERDEMCVCACVCVLCSVD